MVIGIQKVAFYKKAKYKPYHTERLTQLTIDGTYVRSKSEALIYNYLYTHGYIFIYECPIQTMKGIVGPMTNLCFTFDDQAGNFDGASIERSLRAFGLL